MRKRIMFLSKFYIGEGKGVMPFVYGRDYRPDMSEEELEYIDKGIFVAMDERIKCINGKKTSSPLKIDAFQPS
jgi:hypothetical protein